MTLIQKIHQFQKHLVTRLRKRSTNIVTQYALLALPNRDLTDFILSPTRSLSSDDHAKEAKALLAEICNTRPDDLDWNHLSISPEFFMSLCVQQILNECVYTIGEDVLAHALAGSPGGRPTGAAGDRWFPLHMVSYVATFVSNSIFPIFLITILTSYCFSVDPRVIEGCGFENNAGIPRRQRISRWFFLDVRRLYSRCLCAEP